METKGLARWPGVQFLARNGFVRTYVNRTQATNVAAQLGPAWEVYRALSPGRGFFVGTKASSNG